MPSRLDLQNILSTAMDGGKVYFQPPSSVILTYPCIVYKRQRTKTEYADNKPYTHSRLYQITLIDNTPDSPLVDVLISLPGIAHSNNFSKDGLSHDVFDLFY